jgi:hypothetical protein
MNSMLIWLSILLLLTIIIYYLRNKIIVKEKFQNFSDPDINLNVTVSPTLLNSAREILSNMGFNEDLSGNESPTNNRELLCAKLQKELSNYNSELQRHRDEGNWTHTHAVRSYINIIYLQLNDSGCLTN